MKIIGFKCDRCGKVFNNNDSYSLGVVEVGEGFLERLPEKHDLCRDCYDEFCENIGRVIDEFLSEVE